MKLGFSLILITSLSASTTRFVTYNLLNYSSDGPREENYVEILELIEPDLIVVQEIISQTGYDNFKSNVLDVLESGAWSAAPFISQTAQQDIGLYYHHNEFTFLNTSSINTAQSSGTRDVIQWVMVHNQSGVEFNIYGVHLKASSGSANAEQRLAETTILRNHLNSLGQNKNIIVAGDFNIYSNNASSEPAFDMLTSSGSDDNGQLFDPIDRVGNWHNNSSFSDVHTQSPRTTQFGGGANGGMDDRFDWLFVSGSMLNINTDMYYVENTYQVLGNDGNHFNAAINSGTNSVVSNQIANALHSASDHLPVYMDVWFDDLTYGDSSIVISEVMVNPSFVSDSYGEWLEIVNRSDNTINLNGWTIKDGDDNQHLITIADPNSIILPGEYFILSRNNNISINGGFISDYVYENISLSNTQDVILLLDDSGAIIDEVNYTSSWPYSNGVSMELHDISLNNNNSENWFSATHPYGDGDLGTPGSFFDDTLSTVEERHFPVEFNLSSPYPNPFNPSTSVEIYNPFGKKLTLEILNINGQIINSLKKEWFEAGVHNFKWDAKKESTGVYFFKLSDSKSSVIRKVLLIK